MDINRIIAIEAAVRRLAAHINGTNGKLLGAIAELIKRQDRRVPSIQEALDAIPGRRIVYNLVSEQTTFGTADQGRAGTPATFQVSQDGPFVLTHYPFVLWRVTAPENATNFGRWRPITSFPLPDQVYDTDTIDISYQLLDAGSERNLQNAAAGPLLSRPDNLIPLPVPTLFASAAAISFVTTFNRVTFDGATPPTAGVVHVLLPGYRIVNL